MDSLFEWWILSFGVVMMLRGGWFDGDGSGRCMCLEEVGCRGLGGIIGCSHDGLLLRMTLFQ